jgi:predicted AlkP superfamily pyrophosphatase or phosphodiesterase
MNHTTSRPGTLFRNRRLTSGARLLLASVLLLAAAGWTTCAREDDSQRGHTVILVSIDGFRWDYLDRGITPNLNGLAERGVRAEGLVPPFPTKTFPSHYTMVTGLVPDRHGIVSNTMYDPVFDARFSMSKRDEVQNGRWYEGEPVWVTAERAGRRTAPLFWPGSEAEIDGVRPSHWLPFDVRMPYRDRVQWVLDRLDLPEPERPTFLTLYFAGTDHAGHETGPDSEETLAEISRADAAVGRLLEGLETRRLLDRTNVVVVSDHGMISTSPDRVIFVDDFVDPSTARPVDWNPVLALWPDEEDVIAVYEALRDAHPNMSVYLRDSIPARFDFGRHRRVPPILGLADPGWSIASHEFFERWKELASGGSHGYDHEVRDMQGIFVAAGPAFRKGARVPAFRNVDVYPLLMAALGLPAAPSDGDLSRVRGMLVE